MSKICEWCGMPIDETGEQCPARDAEVACDPEPYAESV